jgi:hypothetical protein
MALMLNECLLLKFSKLLTIRGYVILVDVIN